MNNTEILLGFIAFMHVIIWMYVRWIYLKIEYQMFDPMAPTNCYGEGLVEGIQNAHARGLRGIATYD